MQYQQLLALLKENADQKYRDFHKRLLKNENINVIGVRVPILRKIAKQFKDDIDDLMSFPDEYYEVTFIKLTAVSKLPYEQFTDYADKCILLIDNWATCDCFVPKCIEKHKDDFLPYIYTYSYPNADSEFQQRFALTTLLHFYVEEKYLGIIMDTVQEVDTSYYYVHMAAAWLIAEMLVKYFDETLLFLKVSCETGLNGDEFAIIDKKTHNKAIQKAIESFRLSDEQKKLLKEIKR